MKRFKIANKAGVYGRKSETRRLDGKPDICYDITFKVDGRKRWEKIGWKSEGYTPQYAVEVRAKRIREARHGKQVKTQKEIRTEKRLHDRALREIKEHYFSTEKGLAIKGRVTDLNRWQNHLAFIEEKRVSELGQLDIERIKREMKGKAPATIANTLELLRRIINHGANIGYCPALSFKIKKPKVNNERTEFLTDEEYSRLISVLDGWPNQDAARMIKLAVFTGMRRGELFKLQWSHIDFQNGFITLVNPKGGKDANVPLNPIARQILQKQQEWTKSHQSESPYVFPGRNGGQRVECSAVTRVKKKAKLPKEFRPFHGLRHHYAVTLANSGDYTLDMIGELLTHANSQITRRYAKFLPDAKKAAADRAAELLTPKQESKAVIAINSNNDH